MADAKISELTSLTSADTGDLLPLVDVSDTSMAASGTNKRITLANLLSSLATNGLLSTAAAPELIRDTMGTALVAGSNVTITVNDGADTITIAATGGGGGASALDDLTDVTITSAATGNVLRYNGTAWVNVAGSTFFEAAGAVATHEADTTNVHGIADTSALETTSGATSKVSTHAAVTSGVHGISSFAATLLDDANAAAARTTLELGSLATLSAVTSSQITDGTIVDADISASAAIDLSKLATDPRARSSHTGTQTASTISDFAEAVDDEVATLLQAGSNITLTYNDAGNQLTIAAAGGTAPAFPSSTITSNRFYVLVTTTSAGGFTAGVRCWVPVYAPRSFTCNGLGINVTTLAAGAVCRLGLYTDSSGVPGALLADGGTVDCSTTGEKVAAISVALTPGPYWACAWFTGGSPSTTAHANNVMPAFMMGQPNVVPGTFHTSHFQQTGLTTDAPLPDPAPSVSSLPQRTGPVIGLRSA